MNTNQVHSNLLQADTSIGNNFIYAKNQHLNASFGPGIPGQRARQPL
jgi:hypothetical protein